MNFKRLFNKNAIKPEIGLPPATPLPICPESLDPPTDLGKNLSYPLPVCIYVFFPDLTFQKSLTWISRYFEDFLIELSNLLFGYKRSNLTLPILIQQLL